MFCRFSVAGRGLPLTVLAVITAHFSAFAAAATILSKDQLLLHTTSGAAAEEVSVLGMSADGTIIVGDFDYVDQDGRHSQGYFHNRETGQTTQADTLNGIDFPNEHSTALGVSEDSNFVVGESASSDGKGQLASTRQAFYYDRGNYLYQTIKSLSGKYTFSAAMAISLDNRIIVGESIDASDRNRGFYYRIATEEIHAIPDLPGREQAPYEARARDIGGEGEQNTLIIGNSYHTYDDHNNRAFVYRLGDDSITALGTLKNDRSGSSFASAISSDASTVVGWAQSEPNNIHAFSYATASGEMTDLGTLQAGNRGISAALGVNGDGSVIVGSSTHAGNLTFDDLPQDNDPSEVPGHAFYYDARTKTMTDLGTLPGDSVSWAAAVNGDGSVVAGVSQKDQQDTKSARAVVWRIKREKVEGEENQGNGNTAVNITLVDATSTREKAFTQMAEKDHDLHALARGQLDGLATMHCALEDKTYCIGAFGTANRVGHGGHLFSSGIHGALRFAPRWRAGLSLSYLANDNLPGGIKNRGRHTPGVGAYLRYAQNPDRSGLSVTASAAWQKQKLAIRRPTVGLTEPGRGDSEIKGTLLALDGAYGVKLAEGTLLSPTLGLRYLNTRRDGYQETRDASFPATYGKSGEKSTALRVGVGLDHALSARWSLHGDAGTRIVLDRDRDPFTVHADYIGGDVFERTGRKGRVLPYANAGLSARWGADDASLARLRVGMAKSDYGDSAAHIGVSYDYRF